MAFNLDPRIIMAGMQQGPSAVDTMRSLSDLVQGRERHQASLASLLHQQQQEQMMAPLRMESERALAGQRAASAQASAAELKELGMKLLRNQAAAVKSPEQYARFVSQLPQEALPVLGLGAEYDPGALEMFVGAGIPAAEQVKASVLASEAKTKREWEAEQKRLDRENRTRNAGIIAGDKRAAREDKVEETKAKAYLEGYELAPDARPGDKELSDIRGVQANTWTIKDTVAELKRLYQTHGNSPLPGPVKARMSQLATDLKMAAKGPEMYALGVIAGPDEKILDRVISDPTSANATLFDFLGDDQSLAKLEGFASQTERRFKNKARSLGFRAKGGTQAAPAPTRSGPTRPTKKLSAQEIRRQLDEIDAELAAGGGE